MVFNHNSRFYSNSMFLCSGDLIVTHRSHLHFIKSQLLYFHNIKTISLTFCNKVFFFQEYLIRKQYSFICQETIRQRGFLISLSLYFSSRRLLRFRLITRIIQSYYLSISFSSSAAISSLQKRISAKTSSITYNEQRTMSGEPYLNDTLSPSMMPKDDGRITTINPIIRKIFLNLTN